MSTKSIAILACLFSLVFTLRLAAQAGDVAVVLNLNNSATNISRADLQKIFAGEKHNWPGSNTPIKLFLRAPGSHEQIALLRLLGMSEAEYKQHWTAQIFRGEADSEPVTIASFGMALEATKTFLGAICLIDASNLKPGMLLKVIKIDGRLPGDPGYALH